MYEYFQPFEESRVLATCALFAPLDTLTIQQGKYQKLQHTGNVAAHIEHVVVACSSDGRIRVFINERLCTGNKIREEENEEEVDSMREVEEVPVDESDEDDSDELEEEKKEEPDRNDH